MFGQRVSVDGKKVPAGNEDFAKQISEWVFGEKSVIKVQYNKHHRKGETAQHGIYRIKDKMVFRTNKIYDLQLLKLQNKKWNPFTPDDVQFEAVMLDPYIRRTMKPMGKNLTVAFTLPDHYGVFTLKIDYKRYGLTYFTLAEQVQVRPFRHDQYPRFLIQAYPYYVNIFSMMAAFFVFSIVFLYHKESSKKVKVE